MVGKVLPVVVVLLAGFLHTTIGDQNTGQAVQETSISDGQVKYDTYCAVCHGLKGEGLEDPTKAFDVASSSLVSGNVADKTDKELFSAISEGVEGSVMLEWGALLSEEEVWQIIDHIRELQKEA